MKNPPHAADSVACGAALRRTHAPLPQLPAPVGVPKPGPATDAPYIPLPIVQGGVVFRYIRRLALLEDGARPRAEQYNLSQAVPGRISSIVNIHNPSIEVTRSNAD